MAQAKRSHTKSKPDNLAVLPFVTMRRNPKRGEFPRCFWGSRTVEPSGNIWEDTRRGAQYAKDFVRVLREDRFPGLLGWVVKDMTKSQKLDPVMVGFFHEIAVTLMANGATTFSDHQTH
jgi:hypothetical protein